MQSESTSHSIAINSIKKASAFRDHYEWLIRNFSARGRHILKTFKAQWLLYVPPRLISKNCLVWIAEQTAIIFLYSIN
jgi:hypothetical protein